MAEVQQEQYKFPDEQEAPPVNAAEEAFDIDIIDDTPEEDRGRFPANPETIKKIEVETDELDQYSADAKKKIITMKRLWHDERRAKEAADRERQAAIHATQKLLDENKRIKQMLSTGEQEYVTAVKNTSEMQLEMAKKAYKEAYDSGDSDRVLEAQQAITNAAIQLDKVKSFKVPPLQEEEYAVQRQEQVQDSRPDTKAMAWQERNSWFGQDEEMTASALGLHEKLKKQGVVIGSDEYYTTLDKTIRRRFPENFGSQEGKEAKPREDAPKAKPSTVVAPATRSTAPKQVRLKTSQVQLAKKLGLTNEQYARELLKMEA